MNDREIELVLTRLVKIGKVTSVEGNMVRVYFEDEDMTSAPLPVLRNQYMAGEEYTDLVLPAINSKVVVIYLPFPDSDGFVIGGI